MSRRLAGRGRSENRGAVCVCRGIVRRVRHFASSCPLHDGEHCGAGEIITRSRGLRRDYDRAFKKTDQRGVVAQRNWAACRDASRQFGRARRSIQISPRPTARRAQSLILEPARNDLAGQGGSMWAKILGSAGVIVVIFGSFALAGAVDDIRSARHGTFNTASMSFVSIQIIIPLFLMLVVFGIGAALMRLKFQGRTVRNTIIWFAVIFGALGVVMVCVECRGYGKYPSEALPQTTHKHPLSFRGEAIGRRPVAENPALRDARFARSSGRGPRAEERTKCASRSTGFASAPHQNRL